MNTITNHNFRDCQPANDKVKELIKALCNLVSPAFKMGHVSFTIDKCKNNNRIVFKFNEYFLINVDNTVFYCLKSEIN